MTEFKRTFRVTIKGPRQSDLATPLQVLLVLFGGVALAWAVQNAHTQNERWLEIGLGVVLLLLALGALQKWKKIGSGETGSPLQRIEQLEGSGGEPGLTKPGFGPELSGSGEPEVTVSHPAPGVTTTTTKIVRNFKFAPLDLTGKDPNKMLSELEERLRQNPQDKEAWQQKGQLLATLGRGQEAGEAFLRYLSFTGELSVNLKNSPPQTDDGID